MAVLGVVVKASFIIILEVIEEGERRHEQGIFLEAGDVDVFGASGEVTFDVLNGRVVVGVATVTRERSNVHTVSEELLWEEEEQLQPRDGVLDAVGHEMEFLHLVVEDRVEVHGVGVTFDIVEVN